MENITYDHFCGVHILSGTVIRAEAFPKAKKPAIKVWVDFGISIGILQSSAQITVHYTPETLLGKQVMGCVNLGEKNIAGFVSQFLLLGFADKNGNIVLAVPDNDVPNGEKLM